MIIKEINISIIIMDLDSEVKAAIKELPPAERVIAVGLKNIFLEIKELVEA